MTLDATLPALTPPAPADPASLAAALHTLDERTRAVAEVTEALRPLIAVAQQAPAAVAAPTRRVRS